MRKQLSAGDAISTTFSIFFANIIPFMILVFIILSPYILYSIFIAMALPSSITNFSELASFYGKLQNWQWAGIGAQIFLFPMATAALTYGVFQHTRGKDIAIGDCIGVGLGRLLPVLGVAIVSGLAMMGGFICLVIPGIIIMCMLYLATVVAVVEREGVMASLKRSKELTQGSKMTIFGILIILVIISAIVTFIMKKIAMGAVRPGDLGPVKNWIMFNAFFTVITHSVSAIVPVVVYQTLRSTKENTDLEELARVFD